MSKRAWPSEIFLQSEDGEYSSDTSWCQDRINDDDVRYVLPDPSEVRYEVEPFLMNPDEVMAQVRSGTRVVLTVSGVESVVLSQPNAALPEPSEALREALRKYGRHTTDCAFDLAVRRAFDYEPSNLTIKCNCGLAEALAAPTGEPAKPPNFPDRPCASFAPPSIHTIESTAWTHASTDPCADCGWARGSHVEASPREADVCPCCGGPAVCLEPVRLRLAVRGLGPHATSLNWKALGVLPTGEAKPFAWAWRRTDRYLPKWRFAETESEIKKIRIHEQETRIESHPIEVQPLYTAPSVEAPK